MSSIFIFFKFQRFLKMLHDSRLLNGWKLITKAILYEIKYYIEETKYEMRKKKLVWKKAWYIKKVSLVWKQFHSSIAIPTVLKLPSLNTSLIHQKIAGNIHLSFVIAKISTALFYKYVNQNSVFTKKFLNKNRHTSVWFQNFLIFYLVSYRLISSILYKSLS